MNSVLMYEQTLAHWIRKGHMTAVGQCDVFHAPSLRRKRKGKGKSSLICEISFHDDNNHIQ